MRLSNRSAVTHQSTGQANAPRWKLRHGVPDHQGDECALRLLKNGSGFGRNPPRMSKNGHPGAEPLSKQVNDVAC